MIFERILLRNRRRRIRREVLNRRRRNRSDRSINPLLLHFAVFKGLFRLTKPICRTFLDLLVPHMQERYSHGLTKEQRVMCALRFFAVGSYQKSVGEDRKMSQASVSRCINEVAEIIIEQLGPRFLSFPTTQADVNAVKQGFYQKHGIPGVIGCVDCTHIHIKPPIKRLEQVYYSVRKAGHTKNVQIICDSNLRILHVNPKFGGSTHDSYVFYNSDISEYLKANYISGDRTSWLLGDSGYALLPYLMTPIPHPENEQEESYNKAHKACRSTVERCIGVLKSRFRCLSKQRMLMYDPVTAGKIIGACCILHNIMIQKGYQLPTEQEIAEGIADHIEERGANGEGDAEDTTTANLLRLGRIQRQELIRTMY